MRSETARETGRGGRGVFRIGKKGKLGAHAMNRVAAGAHRPTPWLFEYFGLIVFLIDVLEFLQTPPTPDAACRTQLGLPPRPIAPPRRRGVDFRFRRRKETTGKRRPEIAPRRSVNANGPGMEIVDRWHGT